MSTTVPAVGRLAPSPTGPLHLGHARCFVIAWWHSRQQGGRVLLRQEDLDRERSSQQWLDLARRDLEWLGLDWDEEQLQSAQAERIHRAATALLRSGRAYPCVCSRGDIRAALSAPHGQTGDHYPGTCRDRYRSLEQAKEQSGKAGGLRFRCPQGTVHFEDGACGPVSNDPAEVTGDFLIVRRDRCPAYHLAVVVDDAASGVTDVVRGRDLLESTTAQIALQRALGLTLPRYFHLPLVVDEAGKRLAKRHASLSLRELRNSGVSPEQLIGWIARSHGLDVAGPAKASELTRHFRWRQPGEMPETILMPHFL